MTKIEELEQKVKELSEEIGQLKNQGKVEGSRFIPEKGERYWTVNSWGVVDWFAWQDGDDDRYLLANSPVFRTEEEAERYLKFKQELAKRRWLVTEEEWKNRNIYKYYIAKVNGEIYADYCNTHNCIGTIYFKSKEDAAYIANNFKDELLEYWL